MFNKLKSLLKDSWQKIAAIAVLGTALVFGGGRDAQAASANTDAPVTPESMGQVDTQQAGAEDSLFAKADFQRAMDIDDTQLKAHDDIFRQHRGQAISADAPFPVGRPDATQAVPAEPVTPPAPIETKATAAMQPDTKTVSTPAPDSSPAQTLEVAASTPAATPAMPAAAVEQQPTTPAAIPVPEPAVTQAAVEELPPPPPVVEEASAQTVSVQTATVTQEKVVPLPQEVTSEQPSAPQSTAVEQTETPPPQAAVMETDKSTVFIAPPARDDVRLTADAFETAVIAANVAVFEDESGIKTFIGAPALTAPDKPVVHETPAGRVFEAPPAPENPLHRADSLDGAVIAANSSETSVPDAVTYTPTSIEKPTLTMRGLGEAWAAGIEYTNYSGSLGGTIHASTGEDIGRLEDFNDAKPFVLSTIHENTMVQRAEPHTVWPFPDADRADNGDIRIAIPLFSRSGTAKNPVVAVYNNGEITNPEGGANSLKVFSDNIATHRVAYAQGIADPQDLLNRLQDVSQDNPYEMLSIMAQHKLLDCTDVQQRLLQMPPETLRAHMPDGTAFDEDYTQRWLAIRQADTTNADHFVHTLSQALDVSAAARLVIETQQPHALQVLQQTMAVREGPRLRPVIEAIEAAETQQAIETVRQAGGR